MTCLRCGKEIVRDRTYEPGYWTHWCADCHFSWRVEKGQVKYWGNSIGTWVEVPEGCLVVFGE